MFQRIVVPLDGTDLSARSLPYAVEMARKFSAELILVTAVQPGRVVTSGVEGPGSVQILIDSAQEKEALDRKEAVANLDAVARDCERKGARVTTAIVNGAPADEILKLCRERKADLVIMTTHGRSGIKRAVLGSVTDAIARSNIVPVLMIRPELPA